MIKKGTVVGLSYSLKNAGGETLDQADGNDPFIYLHGSGQIIPGLENALEGLNIGDKKTVVVPPKDGYGEINPQLKMKIDRSSFPAEEQLQTGMQFAADGGEAGQLVFTILDINDQDVMVDGNHPLAGETLHFAVEVLSIRTATSEELSHGHAHGAHGHSHH